MNYYEVGFLEGDVIKEVLIVRATSKNKAYKEAEEIFKRNRWNFTYTDLYSNLLPF